MNTKKIEKYLLKLKDAFLDETIENKKMLDIYVKYIEGYASDDEIEEANYQLKQVFRSLGLGILVILPFSPISIPYVLKRAKEYNIDLIDNVKENYDGIVLAVKHKKFKSINLEKIKNDAKSVIFDLKGFYPRNKVNSRL